MLKLNFNTWVLLALLFATSLAIAVPVAAVQPIVFLEDLTSFELSDAIRSGKTTVIIPIGGTEQNGPHMALGKHNVRGKILAQRIALQLGNAIVAPILAYVPEGSYSPPTSHMRWAGTISVSDVAFVGILEGAARSFKVHGFTDIVFIGEHGGYQKRVDDVAASLNRSWLNEKSDNKDKKVRAHFIPQYYRASQTAFAQALKSNGLSDQQIGVHAGTADTSLMLATDESLVRRDQLAKAAKEGAAAGVTGDPRPSTVALGEIGVKIIIEQTVKAIREAVSKR